MGHDPRIPRSTVKSVYARAGGAVCEDCEGERLSLELHHLRYEVYDDYHFYGDSIHGREQPDDLALLCRNCHHQRHIGPLSGDFHVDPVEVEMEYVDIDRWEKR